MNVSRVRRTLALVSSVIVAVTAVIVATDKALADPTPITNWSFDTTQVSAVFGGDVNLTIDDPIIRKGRYVSVDALHFTGERYQTIDTGIVLGDNLPNVVGADFTVQANATQTGGGYLFSTSGVYTSTASSSVLLPRYGVYYGTSPFNKLPRDSHQSGMRTVLSTGNNIEFPTGITQTNIALPITGSLSATISNPTGSSFREKRSLQPPDDPPKVEETTAIGQSPSILGDGTLLIGGVGGPCLATPAATACDTFWSQDDGFRSYSHDNLQFYRSSMFQGDMTSFKVFGNPGKTSDTNNSPLFDGIPAYDMVTGYCGFFDRLSSQFKTAQTPSLIECTTPRITAISTNPDSSRLIFDYETSVQYAAAPGQTIHAPLTSVDGALRFSVPALPQDWSGGDHEFILMITSGSMKKSIIFTLCYVGAMPHGQLRVEKHAWIDVPPGTSYSDIINGNYTEIPSGSVLPSNTILTFTYTVTYEVEEPPGIVYTGLPGLPEVIVAGPGVDDPTVCTLRDLLVNIPSGCASTELLVAD